MKRRRFVQALAAFPVAAPLAAQQPPANQSAPGIPLNPTQGIQPPARAASEDLPKLEASVAEAAAEGVPRFFNPSQFSALKRLGEILMPAGSGSPGALAAGAPEFLDFLIGDSGPDRQTVYRTGLDSLNAQSRKQFGKAFADTDDIQAGVLLVSLRQPWTFEEPSDPVAKFLRSAKADMRTATLNSHAAGAGRRISGSGLYWYPLD